jgi:uncharacterized membrane protein YwzB
MRREREEFREKASKRNQSNRRQTKTIMILVMVAIEVQLLNLILEPLEDINQINK